MIFLGEIKLMEPLCSFILNKMPFLGVILQGKLCSSQMSLLLTNVHALNRPYDNSMQGLRFLFWGRCWNTRTGMSSRAHTRALGLLWVTLGDCHPSFNPSWNYTQSDKLTFHLDLCGKITFPCNLWADPHDLPLGKKHQVL